MNQTTGFVSPAGIPLWFLIFLAISFLISATVLTAVIYLRRQSPSVGEQSKSASLYFQSVIVESGWLLIPMVIICSFATLTGPKQFLSAISFPKSSISLSIPDTEQTDSSPLQSTKLSGSFTLASASESASRPEWCHEGQTVVDERREIVLSSRQYATKQEAENELAIKAHTMLVNDLKEIYGAVFTNGNSPAVESILKTGVKRKHIEVLETDFGNFNAPMYRAWWQIELSPAVRAEFYPAWRQIRIVNRIVCVAAAASFLAMLTSAGAFFYRIDANFRGRLRRLWRTVSLLAIFVWGLMSIFLGRHTFGI